MINQATLCGSPKGYPEKLKAEGKESVDHLLSLFAGTDDDTTLTIFDDDPSSCVKIARKDKKLFIIDPSK